MPDPLIPGLHHVTAIASDPQRNVDFYVGTLGLRLVKRTVNFDDPGSYHLYYGDERGTPGTIVTFFPWPGARRGQAGTGEVAATAYAIPSGAVEFWLERLRAERVPAERAPERWGAAVIRLADPDGMPLELIAAEPDDAVMPWHESAVPPEQALRGFHGVTAALETCAPTAKLLTEVFGYRLAREEGNRFRFEAPGADGAGKFVDLLEQPGGRRGTGGAGSVHHIAFRVADDAAQWAWRERLVGLGYQVSPVMDRTYFHSIYFREPGGILFEIATDPPGFGVDETMAELGGRLQIPPWTEKTRGLIESRLPPITLPPPVSR